MEHTQGPIEPTHTHTQTNLIFVESEDLTEKRWGGDLAQDRDQWRALVNTVMNLGVP
jgi:hypothetical protein